MCRLRMLGLDQDPALVRIGGVQEFELDPPVAPACRRASELLPPGAWLQPGTGRCVRLLADLPVVHHERATACGFDAAPASAPSASSAWRAASAPGARGRAPRCDPAPRTGAR